MPSSRTRMSSSNFDESIKVFVVGGFVFAANDSLVELYAVAL